MDASRQRVQIRGTRTVPRNADNQIYCDHQDCQQSPPTFSRPCEWNKHMDKHDRPFECHEPGCNRDKGFTYAGGLSRHQREVHKKDINGPPIMCPYTDCGRSSGEGFTRQGNLQAHLRRRHLHTNGVSCGSSMQGNPRISTGVHANHLPAALVDHCQEYFAGEGLSEANDAGSLRKEFKELIRDVQEQNRRLEELEHTVTVLQDAIAPSSHLQLKKQYDPVRP